MSFNNKTQNLHKRLGLRKIFIINSGKVFVHLFQKGMFAFGKLRLCLVGSRLHFPSENRQSRAKFRLAFQTDCAPQAVWNHLYKELPFNVKGSSLSTKTVFFGNIRSKARIIAFS